jgi:transcriptional regulator with XRE-family HTH domain
MVTGLGEIWPSRQLLTTQRLRQRRNDLGLTQKQIVTRLARQGVRTTNRALSSLEHGAGVDIAKLPELAEALDCTVTYLVGLTDDPHRWEPDVRPAQPPAWPQASGIPQAPRGSGPPQRRSHSWILGLDVPDRVPGATQRTTEPR